MQIEKCCQILSDRLDFWIIQRLLEVKHLRFSGFLKRNFKTSTRTLTKRLKKLENCGVISRQAFAEAPPRVEYRLTQKGLALRKVLLAMSEWSKKHA
ncbi:transcriptional regulator [Candidatus Parcubacteria bacterium]|jgi:DNA-binding HxlR family transcriptional regulator|nr:MAG: transcriptional regulator [Candidatus Parcubacteria bacterium]